MTSKLKTYIKVLKCTFVPFGLGCVIADLIKIVNNKVVTHDNAIVDIVFLSVIAVICLIDTIVED